MIVQLSLFDEPPASASPPAAVFAPTAPPVAAPAIAPKHAAPVPQTPVAPLAQPKPVAAAPSRFMHPQAEREIQLREHRVGYVLRRSRRSSIGFVVSAEGLIVSAPRWVGQGEIDSALREKANWLLRKLHEQHERAQHIAASRIEWREGASIPYLGEKLVVVIDPRCRGAQLNTDASALPGVTRLALHVGLPQNASSEQLREAVQSWLQRQARRIFEERCALYAPRLGVRMTRLSLSSASTRWGSASVDGSIRLNWRLVHFGLPVIDYVVTHELAHLRVMDHSAAFWGVVRTVLPEYEVAQNTLRDHLLPAFE